MISVLVTSKRKFVVDRIAVCAESLGAIETIIRGNNGSAIMSTNKGRNVFRLLFDDSAEVPFRDPDELDKDDQDLIMHETTHNTEDRKKERQPDRKVFAPMSSIVSKLFPLENALETVGSPEEQFFSLMIRGGLVPTVAF